ncbi:MAG: thiamine-phosphate diphosphorylase [Polaromonas sp.]|jgi:thiamine-phosphate pyrophosphorylase|nr:thiamine-phosphate diphosphorylase [Polaromonas sp.]MDB5845596.1 thiamine-phosphate diphosphorylase [Polaromonas sp.]MDB5939731.1 thiamine-phosphate diphosphorylase [Polaromonas sp.]
MNSTPLASFAPLTGPIGFYPVVHDAAWVRRLLGWGVRTVQLRFKADGHTPAEIEREVRAAVEASRSVPGAQVFINDHWQLALAAGAYGVHLGQEDLDTADIGALRDAGLRLGLSTHTPDELARAQAVQPSYLAIGPVYPTTLKVMPYAPVGLERLTAWAALAAPYPVVAIGGISLERLPGVLACLRGGVDGAAVVSAVTLAADPQQAALDGLRLAAG